MASETYLPPLVVAAFNRVNSLQRLLASLEQADYPASSVPLVISIDKNDNQDVIKLAEQFNWSHGAKRIIVQPKHLGLKQHILRCGDLTAEYGSIILFEDDLYASKYFYDYTLKALNFYDADDRVAGISLYSYDIAENGFQPFVPVDDGASVYFMQIASSWGQAWTANQWRAFKQWFQQNPEMNSEELPPAYLLNWSENSWKKHFIRYLHHSEKFFVFPRQSLTTNFEEPGATASTKGLYQVPVAACKHTQVFVKLEDSKAVYDAHFEMRADCLKKWCPFLTSFDFTVDLYGTLPVTHCRTPYLLTVKKGTGAIFSFALEMFPPVLNVVNNLRGDQIKLVKKENITEEKVASDFGYYKYKPVSEIIFEEELVERVEKVYAGYSAKMDALHKSYTEQLEGLHKEIRKLHEDYHRQIAIIHDDYAVKIKSAVEQALKDYQFRLDYPQFAIVSLVKSHEADKVMKTIRSVQQQDYPRIRHLVIVTGSPDAPLTEIPPQSNISLLHADTTDAALMAAESHFNHAESDYHCWLEPGTILLPKALMTVREVFKRFAEVNWVKGLPVKTGSGGELLPVSDGIDFRWNNHRFYNAHLLEITNRLSSSALFWKKHLWHKAGGYLNHSFQHIADVDLFHRLFLADQLYILMANLGASHFEYRPLPDAEHEFSHLKKKFPPGSFIQKLISTASYPFFKRDIPFLRAIHQAAIKYPPLIRFDYHSQSFYLSEY